MAIKKKFNYKNLMYVGLGILGVVLVVRFFGGVTIVKRFVNWMTSGNNNGGGGVAFIGNRPSGYRPTGAEGGSNTNMV
jgi:hypothetical protein